MKRKSRLALFILIIVTYAMSSGLLVIDLFNVFWQTHHIMLNVQNEYLLNREVLAYSAFAAAGYAFQLIFYTEVRG